MFTDRLVLLHEWEVKMSEAEDYCLHGPPDLHCQRIYSYFDAV